MKTLQIEIPKGHEIDDFDQETGVIKFKETPKTITERIKSVEDILNDNDLTKDQFENQCQGLSSDERAYRILKLLAKSLNQGWEPNWDDHNEYKYVCWFDMGSSGFRFSDYGGWFAGSGVGSRLCFKTRELAKHAGNQFQDVWKDYMIIN